MLDFLERTWAVIHLDRLDANLAQIRKRLPEQTKIMGVVKADGYGHGDKMIAGALCKNGVDYFAVSNLDEALSLRRGGIECDILILGFTPVCKADLLFHYHITQTVFSMEYATLLNEKCASLGGKIDVHIKIDTGMCRIGFLQTNTHSAAPEVAEICQMYNLNVTGIFTHLSSADTLDMDSEAFTQLQVARYQQALNDLSDMGIDIPLHHLQNSAGIAFLPDTHFDYARAGIIMYGVAPSGESLPFPLQPVMELKTVVSMVKEVEAGSAISYCRTYVADHPMRLATVPIGYADGYPRALSNKAYMLVKGQRARVVGNVCMDQLILDITHIEDVRMGDEVTVVGTDGSASVTFDELAAITGSISYELMCLIGRRVPRVYMQGNSMIEVVDYIRN